MGVGRGEQVGGREETADGKSCQIGFFTREETLEQQERNGTFPLLFVDYICYLLFHLNSPKVGTLPH